MLMSSMLIIEGISVDNLKELMVGHLLSMLCQLRLKYNKERLK